MFNEGLDIPAVDRVVMLRPTESKVVFLQQLGRGLRPEARDTEQLQRVGVPLGEQIVHLAKMAFEHFPPGL